MLSHWHQWQLAYPTLSSTGTSRFLASSNASGDQGHQSTGLSACWRRYGEVVCASRLAMGPILAHPPPRRGCATGRGGKGQVGRVGAADTGRPGNAGQ